MRMETNKVNNYIRHNNLKAALAIARASLISMLRSPTAVVFSLLFPIIFIVVFGSMVDNASLKMKIAFTSGSDTSNIVYRMITGIKAIEPQNELTEDAKMDALKKGQITAIVDIVNDSGEKSHPHYAVRLTTANAAASCRGWRPRSRARLSSTCVTTSRCWR